MIIKSMKTKYGNPAKNQYLHFDEKKDSLTFVSYGTIIAVRDSKQRIVLDSYYWDYSVTTGQYRNQFLEEGIAETRAKIKSGEYKLADLN